MIFILLCKCTSVFRKTLMTNGQRTELHKVCESWMHNHYRGNCPVESSMSCAADFSQDEACARLWTDRYSCPIIRCWQDHYSQRKKKKEWNPHVCGRLIVRLDLCTLRKPWRTLQLCHLIHDNSLLPGLYFRETASIYSLLKKITSFLGNSFLFLLVCVFVDVHSCLSVNLALVVIFFCCCRSSICR